MHVLGIDPGKRPTFVVLSSDKPSNPLISSTFESAAPAVSNLPGIAYFVRDLVRRFDIKLAAIEGYAFGNKFTLVPLVEAGTTIRLALNECQVPWLEVAPTSLKKFATGSGNTKKEMILMQVFKRWGFEGHTHDQADAFVLASICLYHQKFLTTSDTYEQVFLSGLVKKTLGPAA